ncbi:MAG TPA: hypothetical protein VD926_07175, partial [Acidimicrobiales bacterium]|nr:hypothetical protein [Acidimicrobiales bacterium]
DYAWPADPNRQFLGRAWFQNAWGGDMPYGVAFIHGRPGVTVSSGAAPSVRSPELWLGTTTEAITIDGQLDEDVWGCSTRRCRSSTR